MGHLICHQNKIAADSMFFSILAFVPSVLCTQMIFSPIPWSFIFQDLASESPPPGSLPHSSKLKAERSPTPTCFGDITPIFNRLSKKHGKEFSCKGSTVNSERLMAPWKQSVERDSEASSGITRKECYILVNDPLQGMGHHLPFLL